MEYLIQIEKFLEDKEREALQRRDYKEAGRLAKLAGKFTTLQGAFASKKPTMADTLVFAIMLQVYKMTL